jgi:diguanylate cyclase (GGDEF)-like protein
MLDIDHFKRVNDCHGHHVGDVVLKAIAAHCLQSLRLYDVLGRIGGEEFAILLPNTDGAGAALTAERLCASLRAIEIDGEGHAPIRPTASIGVATIAPGDLSFDCLLARADAAMYAATSRTGDR